PSLLRPAYQHVFEPVGAVRDLLGNPVGNAILHAAVPVRPKAEQGVIKRILRHRVVYEVSNMNDATAQRILRHGRGTREWLYELNLVSFRILHLEVLASIACPRHRRRYSDTLCLEILAHSLRIGRVESRMV